MKKRVITISALCPEGANRAEIAEYTRNALGSWGGGLRPPGAYGEDDAGDPLFYGIEVKSCKVRKP